MDKSDIEDILTGIVTPVDWSNNKDLQMAYIVARDVAKAAIDAYKAKLAEQKPIGYLHANGISFLSSRRTTAEQARAEDYNTPLYTNPCDPQNDKYETQTPDGTLTDEGTKNHDVESSSITLEYRQFAEWCRANPSFDLNSRLHSHSGTIDNGGYISDEKTRIAFAAWRDAKKSLASAPKYKD